MPKKNSGIRSLLGDPSHSIVADNMEYVKNKIEEVLRHDVENESMSRPQAATNSSTASSKMLQHNSPLLMVSNHGQSSTGAIQLTIPGICACVFVCIGLQIKVSPVKFSFLSLVRFICIALGASCVIVFGLGLVAI